MLIAVWALGLGCAAADPMDKVSTDLDTAWVMAEDLGVTSENLNATGGQALDTEPSVGRFPAGLAVAKVVSKAAAPAGARTVRLASTPQDQGAYWNGLLDSLPPVREVTRLHDLGLDPRGTHWRDILKESLRIDCNLCLIYGRLERDHGEADLIGVLWDARLAKALAAFRVPLAADEDRREDEDEETPPDGVLSPAEYEAEASLRELVRGAVWDLTRRDQPTATTQPSPWKSDELLIPRNDRLIFEVNPKPRHDR